MDRVVAAEAQLLGKLSGVARQAVVDGDYQQFRVDGLEVLERSAVAGGGQSTGAARRRERGASFGVGQDAGRGRVPGAPELGRQLGPLLLDDELDQRRGVEVESQRR